MKRTLQTMMAAVVMLGATLAHAQAKPVLIVSLSGYNELSTDINFVGELAGQPNATGMFEATLMAMTQGKGLAGLDKTRPWGLVVTSTETGFEPVVFLPVSDAKQLTDALVGVIGQPTEVEGTMKFQGPGGAEIFVRERTDWAYVTQTANANLPADPVKELAGLNTEYDIAVRAYLQNIPTQVKQGAIQQFKMLAQMGMAAQGGQDPAVARLQQENMEAQFAQLERLVNEADQITIGWLVDSKAKNTHLDAIITAVPGSQLAAQMQFLGEARSDYAGFLMPDAAITVSCAAKNGPAEIERAVSTVKQAREQALVELDKDRTVKDEEVRTRLKGLVGKLFDVIDKTVKTGKTDAGAAVVLAPGRFQLAGGTFVADGPALDSVLKNLAELAAQSDDLKSRLTIERDFDTFEGMKFHHASLTLDDEDARKVFGDRLEMYFGVGPESGYFAGGQGSYELLKSAITRSKTEAGKATLPMQATIALAPVFAFAASVQPDDPTLATLAMELAKLKGKDRVLVTVKPISNGAQYRIEIEEGILQAVGEMAKAKSRQGAAVGETSRTGAAKAF